MGILNVTPNSFFDGGRYLALEQAVAHGLRLVQSGADILDIGGESTRPGSEPVSEDEEKGRALPVVKALSSQTRIPISIDTCKAPVAREALENGASMINDVSALRRDPEMTEVVRHYGCPIVLMHMQGTPNTMQNNPLYRDVLKEVMDFFRERLTFALGQGISREQIILDPGIGFGKRLEHNLALLKNLEQLKSLGCPIMVGASRKSFISHCAASPEGKEIPPEMRLPGSLSAAIWAAQAGADLLRVHDVKETRQALLLHSSIRNGSCATS